MPLFRIADTKLERLKPTLVDKERELQRLVEANLLETLDVHFLETEYRTTEGGRIDTLGVDRNGAPTIIEYKRTRSENVINQALSYLRWLRVQKRDFFEMLMLRKLPEEVLQSLRLDWQNPRVICIAEGFNRFDIDTVEVVPIRIELVTYRFYEQGIFSLETLQIGQQIQLPVKTEIADRSAIDPNVERLLDRRTPEMRSLFGKLQDIMMSLGPNVVEKVTNACIVYRVSKNFAEVRVQKDLIRILLRPLNYDDPRGYVSTVPESHNWTLDRRLNIKNEGDLDYAVPIFQASYNDVV